MSQKINKVTIEEYCNVSRLIECVNQQPLKILNPKTDVDSCHIVFSNYGGGMINGDQIRIKINCKENTKSFIGTQSNSRIFEQNDNHTAFYELDATLEKNALLIMFPDPVVLHAKSRLHQKQSYQLKSNSILFLVDWFSSGRVDIGESFQFHSIESEIKIYYENDLSVLDRFHFVPNLHIPTSAANFGAFNSIFTAYLIGDPLDERLKYISRKLLEINSLDFDLFISISKSSEGVYILRAAASFRKDLYLLCDYIMSIFEQHEYLGFNPKLRKY